MSFEVSVGLVRLLGTHILMLRVMFLHFWRITLVCLALKFVGSWVVLGFSVGMEAFDEFLLIDVPWSQEFSSFGFKPPASGFQSYSYSSLKTSLSIQHI